MNRYEVHFEGEKIGDANNFYSAIEIANEILDTIKKYPKEKDEYQHLQIHCYLWFEQIYEPDKYRIVFWSEKENRFLTASRIIKRKIKNYENNKSNNDRCGQQHHT